MTFLQPTAALQSRRSGRNVSLANIHIDTTRLVGRLLKGRLPTGIDRVCLAYVGRYASIARAVLQKGRFGMLLSKSASEELFAMILEPQRDFARRAAHIIAKSVLFPSRHAPCPDSVVLNIGHSGLEQPGYADWLRKRRLRAVCMVHDLIPVSHPQYCRPNEALRHERRIATVLRTAAAVVTNSRATLLELTAFAARHGLSMPPSVAAPLAAAVLPHSGAVRPIAEPYFVMLSTIEPRKNHGMILNLWRRLIGRFGDSAPRLVVIGQRGWECGNVIDMLERCPVLRGTVVQRAGCSDDELANYLRHAQALLFPSLAEGYGLPLIEALSLGLPVIASDLPVFRESSGSIPEYLDPLDESAWMSCIEDFADSHSVSRNAQLQRITHFKAPTWAAHFEKVEDLLSNAC
jgi:glycosyltransferase involved in cell wall biosynthesis